MIAAISIGVCIGVIGLIVIAPWRRVRNEPPLDEVVQTRILLGEDIDEIALDTNAAEERALAERPIPLDHHRTSIK